MTRTIVFSTRFFPALFTAIGMLLTQHALAEEPITIEFVDGSGDPFNWSDPFYWSPSISPNSTIHHVIVDQGTVNLDVDVEIGDLRLGYGGTIGGAKDLAIHGAFDWAGTLGGTGTTHLYGNTTGRSWRLERSVQNHGLAVLQYDHQAGFGGIWGTENAAWTNAAGGQLELRDEAMLNGSGATLTNAAGGTFIRSGGHYSYLEWSLANHGLFRVDGGELLLYSPSGVNTGTMRVAEGAKLLFGGSEFSHTGALESDGTVEFQSDTFHFASGSSYTGNGHVHLGGGRAIFDSAATLQSFSHNHGTLAGSGTLTVAGDANFSSALMADSGKTVLQGTSNIVSLQLGRLVENFGEATLHQDLRSGVEGQAGSWRNRAGSTLSLMRTAGLSNDGDKIGTLINDAGATVRSQVEVGNSNTINWDVQNHGLIEVTEGVLGFGQDVFNSGTLKAAAGRRIEFAQGRLLLNEVSGTLLIEGSAQLYTPVVNRGTIEVNGGVLDSSSVGLGGGWSDDSFVNQGQVRISGGGEWTNWGKFTNQGTVEIAGGQATFRASPWDPPGFFEVLSFRDGSSLMIAELKLQGSEWIVRGGSSLNILTDGVLLEVAEIGTATSVRLLGPEANVPQMRLKQNFGALEVSGGAGLDFFEMENHGTVIVGGGSTILGDRLHSTQDSTLWGSGTIQAAVVSSGATLQSDSTLAAASFAFESGVSRLTSGNLAASSFHFRDGGILRIEGTSDLDGAIHIQNGGLEILGSASARQFRVEGYSIVHDEFDLPTTIGYRGAAQISGGPLVVSDTALVTDGTLSLVSAGVLNAQAGLSINGGGLTGDGTVVGNVSGNGVTFSSPSTLIVQGSMNLSGGVHEHQGGAVKVTGLAAVQNSVFRFNPSSAVPARLEALDGIYSSDSLWEGSGVFDGNMTLIGGVTFANLDPDSAMTVTGALNIVGGDNEIAVKNLNVTGTTTINGGNLRIAPGAALGGPGTLLITNGGLLLDGRLNKTVMVQGNFIVSGLSEEGLSLNGANVKAEGQAGFGLLDCFGNNEIDGHFMIPGVIAIEQGNTVFVDSSTVEAQELLVGSGAKASTAGTLALEIAARFKNDSGFTLNPTGKMTSGGGNLEANSQVTVGGTWDSSAPITVAGTVNLETGGSLTATEVNVGSGGVVTGSGTIDAPTQVGNIGLIAPGQSPGKLTIQQSLLLGSGAIFEMEIRDAAGVGGVDWDLLSIGETMENAATADNPFVIRLVSLDAGNQLGEALNFDATLPYAWPMIEAAGGISGISSDNVFLDVSGFANGYAGEFGVALAGDGNSLLLTYSPNAVPEPSSVFIALLGVALAIRWPRSSRRLSV